MTAPDPARLHQSIRQLERDGGRVDDRVIGRVGRELLMLDEQCPVTSGICKADCDQVCLRSELPALLDLIRRQDAALTAVRELADEAQKRADRSWSVMFDGSRFPATMHVSWVRDALALASPDTAQEAS